MSPRSTLFRTKMSQIISVYWRSTIWSTIIRLSWIIYNSIGEPKEQIIWQYMAPKKYIWYVHILTFLIISASLSVNPLIEILSISITHPPIWLYCTSRRFLFSAISQSPNNFWNTPSLWHLALKSGEPQGFISFLTAKKLNIFMGEKRNSKIVFLSYGSSILPHDLQ